MISRILLGAATAALLTSSAFAADLPAYEAAPAIVVPSFSWTGAYIGVQAGYAWGNSDIRGNGGRISLDPKGYIVGGYAGYNFQFDNSPVVVGIETDFNYTDADKKRSAGGASIRNGGDWAGATRARIGYAFDRFMVYGAAGVAYADREIKLSGLGISVKDSKTAVGYTVGGGVEYAATDNLIVRAEYRYTDYGSDKFTFRQRGQSASVRSDLDEHRVMGGIAYKFGF